MPTRDKDLIEAFINYGRKKVLLHCAQASNRDQPSLKNGQYGDLKTGMEHWRKGKAQGATTFSKTVSKTQHHNKKMRHETRHAECL